MNDDFAPFELAVKLKEKGFRERVKGYYKDSKVLSVCNTPMNSNALDNEFSAPTISQVLKWLRKEKKIHIEVMFIGPTPNRVKYYITNIGGGRSFMDVADEHYENYEQAALAGIEYTLDNLI